MVDILNKNVRDMSVDEIKATSAWAELQKSALAQMLDEAGLLGVARTALTKLKIATEGNRLQTEALAFLKAMAEKGIALPEGGHVTIYGDGTTSVRGPTKAGGARRFRWDAAKHFPMLIGKSFKKTLSKQAGDRAGDYSLAVNQSLATRADVPFSLVLTSPNGSKVTYPAANRNKPTATEVENVAELVEKSQWGKSVDLHRGFPLYDDEVFAAERAAAEGASDDEADVDETDDENIADLVS